MIKDLRTFGSLLKDLKGNPILCETPQAWAKRNSVKITRKKKGPEEAYTTTIFYLLKKLDNCINPYARMNLEKQTGDFPENFTVASEIEENKAGLYYNDLNENCRAEYHTNQERHEYNLEMQLHQGEVPASIGILMGEEKIPVHLKHYYEISKTMGTEEFIELSLREGTLPQFLYNVTTNELITTTGKRQAQSQQLQYIINILLAVLAKANLLSEKAKGKQKILK